LYGTKNACTFVVAKPSPYDNPNHPPNSEFPPGSGRKTYWALVNLLSKESLSLRRSSASLGSRGLELVIIELVIIAAIIAARRQLCTVEVIIGLRRLQHDRLLLRRAGPGDGRTLSFLFGA
jgi:hypothetical protein